MEIPHPLSVRAFWNISMKFFDGNNSTAESRFSDWQVVVSREKQVLEVKQMNIDMPKTRLKPVYSAAGDLMIVILAESKMAAENRGRRIASRIADAGLWGLDFLDLIDLDFDK